MFKKADKTKRKSFEVTAEAVKIRNRLNGRSRNGKMIRFHRKQSGLPQAELGKLEGLEKSVVFDIEKAKISIKWSTLLKILNVLNMTLD